VDVQVEHLDGHIARLTVTVESEKTQASKKKAAQKLAKELRIPGFRPGKAPYDIVLARFGQGAILQEAVDSIGNEVYRTALEDSKINPAAAGEIEEVKEDEGKLVLVFTVPKDVEVDLKEYRSLRGELLVEEVTDEMVKQALESLRESRAVIEDVD
jgi:trigger factor